MSAEVVVWVTCNYHFPNSMTLCFSVHAKIFTWWFLKILIGSSKLMKFAYQTERQPVHWPIVFSVLSLGISDFRFYKILGLETWAIVYIDMLFYLNNAYHTCYIFMHCLLNWSLCLLKNCARNTLNAIGHCIVWSMFDKTTEHSLERLEIYVIQVFHLSQSKHSISQCIGRFQTMVDVVEMHWCRMFWL